jgi:hypothetical protein
MTRSAARKGRMKARTDVSAAREEIAARGDNLDITWLKDTSGDPEDGLETPEDIAAAIELHLASALVEVRALVEEPGTTRSRLRSRRRRREFAEGVG